MLQPRLLIVDDDRTHCRMLEAVLGAEGYATAGAADGRQAVARVQAERYDLVLMDIRMTGMDGMAALHAIKQLEPDLPIVMMTAFSSVSTAVEAMKAGAYDYLTKPLDTDELKMLVSKALRHHALEKENLFLKEQLGSRFDFANIIGRSRAVQQLLETVALVAPTDATVLIQGESGTGKELIANAIHQNSPRREHPLIKVNCAALPETLLESELFGHERGAFTGATTARKGRFQLAHRGTLFLDEIGEMPLTLQPKLLRVLQERTFEPVGGTKSIQVDTRIVTASNTDLPSAVQEGRFRQDLFYRINVVGITAPPLRKRPEDIALLADHFLKQYAKQNHRAVKGFSPKAIELLMRHPWPGNVRELENLVERSVIMARGPSITVKEFPEGFREAAGPSSRTPAVAAAAGDRSLKTLEKEMILRTLADTGGNRTRSARILGISRRTLQLKLKEYGVN